MELLGFFLIHISLTVVLRYGIFLLQTGINPMVQARGHGAAGYADRAMKAVFVGMAVVVHIHAFAPEHMPHLAPFSQLEHTIVARLGWACLFVSLACTVAAQTQMGKAWRIGIDTQAPAELVRKGLFRFSRNPIHLGTRLTLLGLFLVVPNAVTLALMVAAELLVQIQVRLEEDHLAQVHGDEYTEYATTVRRWL
jgi:protein-S-isoprenylcysteine O-methyltransferase Ste14